MKINRRYVLPALLALAARNADAFAPVSLAPIGSSGVAPRFSMVAPSDVNVDVSVDYDAAAKLAYGNWCNKYGKEASDAKFATFKANYEALTVANVSAAKKARDDGTDRPRDLELNEFGDMTEEEYMKMKSGGSTAEEEAAPRKGALETAMEASVAQSDASNALAEAADALAEEEQKLAEQLGLDSVEELEQALDAMAGIDTDGGEIDTSDVREARVRSAYLDWCKEYGKTADESRFPTFTSNFLAMEEYAQENGREMVLNKYADCTEDEYRQLTNTAAPEPIVESVAKIEIEAEVEVTQAPTKSIESVDYDAAARLAYEAAGSEGAFDAFKAKYLEETSAMVAAKGMMSTVTAPAPESAPKEEVKESAPKEEVKAEAPKKAAPPKAKAAQAPKPAPKPEPVVPVLSLEEEAIKLAREEAEKEAAQVAARRLRDEAAAEMELMKAKEALEKQQKLAATRPAQIPPPPKFEVTNDALVNRKPRSSKPVAEAPEAPVVVVREPMQAEPVKAEPVKAGNIFASLLGGASTTQPKPVESKVEKIEPPKVVAPKVEPPKVEPPKKVEFKSSPFAFFQQPTTKPKPVEKKEPVAPVAKKEPVAPVAEEKEASPFAFFQQPVAETPKAAPVEPKVDVQKADIDIAPNAMTEALNSFFGSKPAAKAPPAPVPAPLPVPALVKTETPKPKQTSFSFFGGSSAPAASKPKATVTPKASTSVPTPKPAPKPAPIFSFGNAAPKKAAPQTPPPAPVVKPPPAKGSGTFSLFGGAATETKKAVVEPIKPAPTPKSSTPAFGSFFGGSAPKSAPKAPPAEPSTPAPVPRGSGTFSLFGGSAPAKPSAPVASTPAKTPVVKKSPPKKVVGVGGMGTFAQTKAPAKPQGTQAIGKSGPGTISIAKTSPPPKKAAQKSPTFSLFGSQPPKKEEPAAPASPTAVKKSGGLSFGGAPNKVTPKSETSSPAKPAQKSPTFSLFGSSPKTAAPAAAATQAVVKPEPAAKSPSFSFGGATQKPAATSDVPVVSNFTQNADGSITGIVSNSKNFRTGTKITTSPVKNGAKAGDIVTTSSGSKYRLQ